MPRSSRQVDAFESRSGHASWRRGKEKKTKRKETSRCAGPCACTSEDFSVIQRRASLQRATGHVPVVMTSSATEFNLQRPPLPLNFRPSLPTLCVPVVSRAGIILGNGPRVSGALSIFLCPKNRRRLVRNLISCFLLARASRPARGRAYESLNYRRWNCLPHSLAILPSFLSVYTFLLLPFLSWKHGSSGPWRFMRMRCRAT